MGRVVKASERGSAVFSIDARTEEVARNLLAVRAEAEGLRHRLRADVVNLAIEIARAVIIGSVEAGVVDLDQIYRRALQSAQSLTAATIYVHPEDRVSSRVEQLARACGFGVADDRGVGRGGCRIQSGGVEIDATLETALLTLERAMKEGTDD